MQFVNTMDILDEKLGPMILQFTAARGTNVSEKWSRQDRHNL
jgi:hypothetical protein